MTRLDPGRLLALARTAPSADNCQPFTFRWDGRGLDVHHDAARARHALDAGQGVSRLTLGMTVEALSLAAGVQGWRARRAAPPPGAWARLEFDASDESDPLADALPERTTDRRPYVGGGLDDPALAAARAAGGGAVRVVAAGPGPARRWLQAADRALLAVPGAAADALRWLRVRPGRRTARGDGVGLHNLGLPPGMSVGVPVLRAAPGLGAVAGALGAGRVAAGWTGWLLDHSAALVVVAAPDASDGSLEAAGRAALRAWLALTAGGFGAQPLSLGPALALAVAREGATGAPPRLVDAVESARLAAEVTLGLAPGELPAFVLRTGRSSPLPAAWRTPRRPVAALLQAAG